MKIIKKSNINKMDAFFGFFFNHGNENKREKITTRWEKRNVQADFRGEVFQYNLNSIDCCDEINILREIYTFSSISFTFSYYEKVSVNDNKDNTSLKCEASIKILNVENIFKI